MTIRSCTPARNLLVVICIVLLILPACIAGEENTNDKIGGEVNQTRTLIAVYLIGSDLETEDDDGTKGIQDFIGGYRETSPEDLSVIVAYGGSKKPGWEGMTIETLPQLITDLKSGNVGDDQVYEYRNPDADMGSKETLTTFLSWVKEHYAPERSYLVFSDHGGGWGGFGADENHDNSGLSLPDFSASLGSSGFSPDLIGFDACLMGTIEVAKTLSPYTPLLVGSEENEPGDGWKNDKWIQILSKDPATDPAEVGKAIIDGYMEGENSEKTLSLIDTTKTDAVTGALDAFSLSLPENDPDIMRNLASAYKNQSFFGGDSAVSVDLVGLSRSLGTVLPDHADTTKAIEESAREMVVYERHGKDRGYANGISIVSPDEITPEKYPEAEEAVSLASGWDSLYQSLIGTISDSAEKISLEKREDGRYELVDPSGYATVQTAIFRVDGDQRWIIGTAETEPDEDDLYTVPDWDGEWYYITDAGSPETVIVPLFRTVDMYEDGTALLSAPVMINDRKAFLEIVADKETVEEIDILPYTTSENGNTMFGSSYLVEKGDVISTDTPGAPEQEKITWTDETKAGYGILPDGEYAVGLTIDPQTGPDESVADRFYSVKDGGIQPVSS